MPMHAPPTMAEREAELAALQAAFDEYIASSRELEEELDAELAKMQEKLADSSAANAALSAQLENIAPQLSSLEKALSESRTKLKEEQKLRRAAEQAQDELEAKFREAEGSLLAVREECDAVHEELAFKESEMEELRLELEVEKERYRVDVEDVKAEAALSSAIDRTEDSKAMEGTTAGPEDPASAHIDDAYVKKLEDELELVTEQLIETEQRLSKTEEKLSELEKQVEEAQSRDASIVEASDAGRKKDAELIRVLQEENAARLEEEHKLREELELTKEELSLTQEELRAVEFDAREVQSKLDQVRAEHREEMLAVREALQTTETKTKASDVEVGAFEQALKAAAAENEKLKLELDNLNTALNNAKLDRDSLVEELEAVNVRFDEAVLEAETRGREAAGTELKAAMKEERDMEISEFKEQFAKLTQDNALLQQRVDEADMSLALAKDAQTRNLDGVEVQSEMVKQLQSQLSRARDDLVKKEKEMSFLVSSLEERVASAEGSVIRLEKELSVARGKLAEAEAHLIVSRREKELAESTSIPRHKSGDSSRNTRSVSSSYHPDLKSVGERQKVARRRRTRSSSPGRVLRVEIRLAEESRKLRDLQIEHDKLKDQRRMNEVHVKRLEEDLKVLQRQLFSKGESGVTTDMSRLSTLGAGAPDVLDDEKSKIADIIESGSVELMAQELKSLEKKCHAQRDYNNQLLSKMLNLQGNIQVFCRIRPLGISEIQKGYKTTVESLSETELGCFDARTNKWKSFAFDRVWGPDQTQQSIFQDVEPIALSVVDGFNACIFAYGQTGSGKTYTMEGVDGNNQRGISYRTIQKIFHLLNLKKQQEKAASILLKTKEERENSSEEFVFDIQIGMLEIYNDECYDLLGSAGATLAEKKAEAQKAGGKASLEIRRDQQGRIEVPNLTKEQVSGIDDVISLLKRGNKNRATAATSLNQSSSRSHMVLLVEVSSGIEGQPGNKGKLLLVDLAGSERVRKSEVEGENLKEAGHINKSLSALGNVMEALDRKASHVPYRDSKLTYLLQDSLGGNSRTMMIVAVTPVDVAYDESVHALQFATRVRRIQIGAAQRNVTSKNLEETVKALTAEMKSLTMQKQKTEGQLHSLKRDNSRIQERLQSLSVSRKNMQSDSKTLEVLRKNNNEMATRWQKEKSQREEVQEELEKAQKEMRLLQQAVKRLEREKEFVEKKVEEKDKIIDKRAAELRAAKDLSTAAKIRARKAQVMGSRGRQSPPKPAKATGTGQSPRHASDVASATATNIGPGSTGSAMPSSLSSEDVSDIRKQVLQLLEKHDKGKVNRIDIIMDKFKGKEVLLLEKMTQRYEGGALDAGNGTSGKTRSELAAERHMERMRKLREGK